MLKGETIMRKVFELEDLDCANCAAKIEREIASIPGVNYVNELHDAKTYYRY